MEGEHQCRHRDVGRDGEDHRAAHGHVVRDAEDEAVQHEGQRGHRLGQRRHQQGRRGGVPDTGVGGEQGGHPEGQAGRDHAEPDPGDQAQPQAALPDPVRLVRVAGAERRADVDLGGHRQRVEQQRQQVPDPHRDLLAAERDRAEPGRDRGGGQRDHAERDRPHRQPVPVPEQGGDLGAAGPPGPHGRPPRGGAVPGGRRGLGDDSAPGGAEQAQVQAVHQQDLERDVQHVGADRDPQRRPRVGQPDQVAVPGVGQVQERNPHGGRPQVADRAGQHVLAGAEQFRDPGRRHRHDDGDRDPAGRGHQVGRAGRAARPVGGTVSGPGRGQAGHRRGRRGGQEDGHPGGHGQRGGRDGQRAERGPPQVPDDRGVGQGVGGLGHDRPERGQRERRDAPVQFQVGPDSQHGPIIQAPWRTVGQAAGPFGTFLTERAWPHALSRWQPVSRCRSWTPRRSARTSRPRTPWTPAPWPSRSR